MNEADLREIVERYSNGELSWRDACGLAGLRDSADLLPLLGRFDLPHPDERHKDRIEAEGENFERLFKGD